MKLKFGMKTEGDVVKEPVKREDEDRIVRTAVERENGTFELTNGQEKTLEKAAAASGDQ